MYWLLLAVALFGVFAREIVLDISDQIGDALSGRYTLPVVLGEAVASVVSLVLMCISCVLGFLLLVWCGMSSLSIVLACCFAFVAVVALLKPSFDVARDRSASTIARYVYLTRIGLLLVPPLILSGTLLVSR
jgi:4-hydroxybenzoate polyprenyltransferase